MKQKTAVIYCRASTSKQGQQWETLENQEEACLSHCNSNDIKPVKFFREQFTWTKSKRPKLIEMLEYIKKSKEQVSFCVIHKIDRWTRWGVVWYENLKKELKNSEYN